MPSIDLTTELLAELKKLIADVETKIEALVARIEALEQKPSETTNQSQQNS